MSAEVLRAILEKNDDVNLLEVVHEYGSSAADAATMVAELQAHPLLYVTERGLHRHVWWRSLTALSRDAKYTAINVMQWAKAKNIPSHREFVLYAHSHPQLHMFRDGRVRIATKHNMINKAGIVILLQNRGLNGALRYDLLCEYEGAYADIESLLADGTAWATGNNIWHASVTSSSADAGMPPYCAIVYGCCAIGLLTVRSIARHMQCSALDVEFAVEILIERKLMRLVLAGHTFVALTATGTSAAGSETCRHLSRPLKDSKKRRKRRPRRR